MRLYSVPVTRTVDGVVVQIQVEAETPERAKRSAAARARYNAEALFPPVEQRFHAQEPQPVIVEALVPEPKAKREPKSKMMGARESRLAKRSPRLRGRLSIR